MPGADPLREGEMQQRRGCEHLTCIFNILFLQVDGVSTRGSLCYSLHSRMSETFQNEC